MPRTAYRKANQRTGVWLSICLGGLAVQIGLMFLLSATKVDERLGAWVIVPAVLPFLLAIALAAVLMYRLNRQRISRVAARLREAGFVVTEKPEPAARDAFFAPIAPLLAPFGLRTGANGIVWFALQQTAPGTKPLLLFEHEYVTGSGKTTQVHLHTIAVWPPGHVDLATSSLAVSPWFFMARYPWLKRRGVRERELSDPAFADLKESWSLLGDAATGSRLLTPGVRTHLAQSPKHEQWSVAHGWVVFAFGSSVDAANVEPMLAHARAVLAATAS